MKSKMAGIDPTASIIALNMNGLKNPIKRQGSSDCEKNPFKTRSSKLF